MKKQIPSAPARRARRHALSSFDQLNEAERERLGKINPLHKRYVVSRGHVVRCSFGCLMTTSKHIFLPSTYETKDSKELVKEYVYTAMVSKERVVEIVSKIEFT